MASQEATGLSSEGQGLVKLMGIHFRVYACSFWLSDLLYNTL